ncbi:MAG: ThiF family adenylyltransferase [Burkholderiales bacterium]|nr:ThiF family adenylyltransferase [Burkholderiales bacterium]
MPIQLEITDWFFTRHPKIFVLKRPSVLAGYRPHIGLGQELCYLTHGEVLLDIYEPVAMVHSCLAQAERVLHDISGDTARMHRADEFRVHWRSDELPALIADDIRVSGSKREFLGITLISPPKSELTFLLIGRNPKQLSSQLESIGYHGPKHHLNNCLVVQIQTRPCFDPESWPPQTLADVLRWLKVLDPQAYKTLANAFESQWLMQAKFSAVVFVSAVGSFGFTFEFALPAQFEPKYYLRHPAALRQRVFKTAANIGITRFDSMEITPEFIHSRNQGEQSALAGLKIHLVGCGTIGGYLATYLSRLGAGSVGGELVLIDHDILSPSNLGRHVLSMKHLFALKAEGLANHLREEFPYVKVTSRPVDVLSLGRLFDCDLVIDATGEEAVSTVINHRHVKKRREKKSPAVLYVWVEGAGYAVRTLFVDTPKTLCYQCQFSRTSSGERRERFPVLLDATADQKQQRADCERFTPFPVSASVSAAGLALDAVMDWRRGEPRHRLRTRRLSEQHTQNRKDSSPGPLEACPACRK